MGRGASADTEVVVVGAGLAGLAAAHHLSRHGCDVVVVEASDQAGGRVRTDSVDGWRLDRGFQVFNTAYPEPGRVLDPGALDLQAFYPGVAVYAGGRLHYLAHPLRKPGRMLTTLRAPVGSAVAKAGLGLLSARDALVPASRLKALADMSTAVALGGWGLSGPLVAQFLRPFLSGVFLEGDLETSARFFHLVWRTFIRGRICVPARGMQAIPQQLAAGIAGLRLGQPVVAVGPGSVRLAGGEFLHARAVVVATDPGTATELVPSLPAVAMHGVTTFYHRAPELSAPPPVLVLDGEERLIANTAVLTEVAPSYGPGGGSLVSTSVLAAPDEAVEPAVRARLAALYGTGTASWDLLATYRLPAALPAVPPAHPLRQPVRIEPGLYICGDHRDTPSIQGAMVSGRRAAQAVLADWGAS